LHEVFPSFSIVVERSVTSGLTALVQAPPQLLLLDMSLSTYDVGPKDAGGRPQNFGGITVFEHMMRRKIFLPVIVITQFPGFKRDDGAAVSLDALREELVARFPELFRALLSYSAGDRQWEKELSKWIKLSLESGASN
jgi:hypothetical protein